MTRDEAGKYFAELVVFERKTQDIKWGMQSHSPYKWLTILGEEYGEACEAALEDKVKPLIYELVQVAAVAQACAEQLMATEETAKAVLEVGK